MGCRYSNAGNFKNNYADPPVGYYNNVGECSWGFKDHDGAQEPVCADPPDDFSEVSEQQRLHRALLGTATAKTTSLTSPMTPTSTPERSTRGLDLCFLVR